MKVLAAMLPLLVFSSCRSLDRLLAPQPKGEQAKKAAPEPDALQQGPPVTSDLGPGQSHMLTRFVEIQEENKKLKQAQEELKATIQGLRQELSRSEADRLKEHNGKLSVQAQFEARNREYNQALARILDLQIRRSRLQQKVYLLSLASRERELKQQLRAGQGLTPEEPSQSPGR